MPTHPYLKELTQVKKVKSFLEAEQEVICKLDDYKVMFPINSPAYALDLVEFFNNIKPLPKKSGQMVFLCTTCADAYQTYCCVESVQLSLLFNP